MSTITDGAELLFDLLGGAEMIGRPVNLETIPAKMREIEAKYRLPTPNGPADGGFMEFVAGLLPFLKERHATVEMSSHFVGIDEYFVVVSHDGSLEASFRYRIGANKTPELTAKFKRAGEANTIRGEVNLDVSKSEPELVRALLTVVCRLVAQSRQFAVRQDGMLWRISDPEYGRLEIVHYRVGGIVPAREQIPLAEIESREENPETALAAIYAYEHGLNLSQYRCHQSIAELFDTT